MRMNRKGNYALELALLLPVFLVLVFGAIDFGRVIYAYNTVAYAARDGARYASFHGAKSLAPAAAEAIANYVTAHVVGIDISVNTTWNPDNNPGSDVRVQVQTTFTFITPFINQNSITLSASSQTVISS